ncbi:hypothetical protein BN970_06452 [Mycolicibacterium conceptionense]|uniref:Uncharacterized protein n=1 Tax=Mycolicibacterium conceptionense TaxID=451644 RepID=A0A0U1DX92_9MYCO|nr:hypothetical protein BN970_06452 [Mycolicibacterium conceptionense]
MGDGQDGALVAGQVLFEPEHALGVEVVGGLVEQQQIRLAQQQLAQRDAAALTTGEVGDRLVGRRAAQRVHGLLELGVDVPGVGGVQLLLQLAHLFHELVGVVGGHQLGDLVVAVELGLDRHAVLDVLADGLALVEVRLLHQDADRGAGGQQGIAVVRLVDAGHDLQHTRLTGTVGTDDADLRAGQEVQADVVKDDLVAVRLANLAHRVDEFGHA